MSIKIVGNIIFRTKFNYFYKILPVSPRLSKSLDIVATRWARQGNYRFRAQSVFDSRCLPSRIL